MSRYCHFDDPPGVFVSKGHNVLAIANGFIARADAAVRPVTHMQLQKLCYMSHGFTLALLDEPLIWNDVEAWDFGPVYPDLYDALKKYGISPIDELIHKNNWASLGGIKGSVVLEEIESRETRIVDTIWKDYGGFSGFQLSALTHKEGTPWSKVYRPGTKHLTISNSMIKEYFVELISARK